jgi:hypothetical protein
MKNSIKNLTRFIMLLVLVAGCQDDDKTFGDIVAPTNLEIEYEIVGQDSGHPNGDGSGLVNLKATADNALSYRFTFSDQTAAAAPQGEYTKRFTQNGVHTYTITAIAYGTGGVSTTTSVEVTVFANFTDDEAVAMLTGGNTKKWYWAAATPGHLGVGPNNNDAANNFWPQYYGAGPFEKAGSPESSCIYDAELTFIKDGNVLKYTQDNGGSTFFNAAYNSVGGSTATTDQCLAFNTSGEKIVSLAPSSSVVAPDKSRKVEMTFSDGGFMGYYIGTSTYEIMEITNTKLVVRAVMGNNPALAWYHIFSTTPPFGGNEPEYTNLVWEDNFDVDGAPDPTKWGYDLGGGGWGNGEAQIYTQSSNNVVVQGGVLKITARKEADGSYTSARIKTENKKEFTYGKVEIRAKLPSGGGTWPALWMLGANYDQPGSEWPNSGEIDIMEHKGNEPGKIHGSLHYPGNFGGNANTNSTMISNPGDYHIYSVIWSPQTIRFFVDGTQFHTFVNNGSVPFNHDFFLIFNVAMGGTFGGTIDPAFTQGTMEVDYVKLYQ